MSDLGWRAQSAQLGRHAKPIEGLREDFGLRAKAAVEALKEEGSQAPTATRKSKGKIPLVQNQGVEARIQRDLEQLETADTKEAKRQAALERKAVLYETLRQRIDVDDEAANDLHEVDFIAKRLADDDGGGPRATQGHSAVPVERGAPLHPEAILAQQQAAKRQMQGGGREEYSTYDQDVAELRERHRRVDELDELNATREAEFQEARERQAARAGRQQKQAAKHKSAIVQQMLKKRQRLNK